MIRIRRAEEGFRYEDGRWVSGAQVLDFDFAYRAGTWTTGQTVVEYRGSIEAARGNLFMITGIDAETERLTLEDLYGLKIRQVRIESVKPISPFYNHDARTLADLFEVLAEDGAWRTQHLEGVR